MFTKNRKKEDQTANASTQESRVRSGRGIGRLILVLNYKLDKENRKLGNMLLEAKKVVDKRQWKHWLQTEADMSVGRARLLMYLARELPQIRYSRALLLLQLPKGFRERIVASGKSKIFSEASISELQKLIKKNKNC